MGDFRSLKVWQESHQVALLVYKITAPFPAAERYGLTSQLRRAAASIPANIAEGCGRNSDAELARYCRISLGSANEVEYHLLLARDLGYLTTPQYATSAERVDTVRRMLSAFIRSLIADS